MTIADVVAAVAPEQREAVRQFLNGFDGAVKIGSIEDAEKLVDANDFLHRVYDSRLSKKVAEYETKFSETKLPDILKAERAKLEAEYKPKPKDPELAAALERIEKIEKEKAETEAKYRREALLGRVAPKFAEAGIDTSFAARFLGNDEAETDAQTEAFLKSIRASRDDYASKLIKDRWRGSEPPKVGEGPQDLKAQYDAAAAKNDGVEMLRLKGLMQRNKE
jgi:hypothetical protein